MNLLKLLINFGILSFRLVLACFLSFMPSTDYMQVNYQMDYSYSDNYQAEYISDWTSEYFIEPIKDFCLSGMCGSELTTGWSKDLWQAFVNYFHGGYAADNSIEYTTDFTADYGECTDYSECSNEYSIEQTNDHHDSQFIKDYIAGFTKYFKLGNILKYLSNLVPGVSSKSKRKKTETESYSCSEGISESCSGSAASESSEYSCPDECNESCSCDPAS